MKVIKENGQFVLVESVVKKYKNERNGKIIAYIRQNSKGYAFCTGKPSDAGCLSWQYDNLDDAEKTGEEYVKNYLNK